MSNTLNKIISCVMCVCFLSAVTITPVYAADEIVTLKEGEPAPFDGTLFSTEAAARLLVDLETNKEMCEIECTKKLDTQSAQLQLEIDIMQASRDALKLRFDETMLIRDSQINFLERQVTKPKIPAEVIFAIGVLSGVALTIGSAYAIGQVAGN